jgi:hypothetical protein
MSDVKDTELDHDPPEGELAETADGGEGPAPADDPKASALSAVPQGIYWVESAILCLGTARRETDTGLLINPVTRNALAISRRHFHTDRRKTPISEAEALLALEKRFKEIRGFLSVCDSIFASVDDQTAIDNTRGYFGTDVTVAAYTYARKSVSFTSQFPALGPKCRTAILIHQLAHYIDARVSDIAGVRGFNYDNLDFDSAIRNVHCYPNFAANATPPFQDERYGLTRPEV